jgi:glycosyltransferase involved in cell wall biosynthesis
VENLAAQATATTGKPPPRIAVVAADGIAGRTIDAIHAIGDCYVSLAHGEAWGMAAFDAAALGKPVLLCAFGGPADYLGPDYPGLIEYHMEPVSGWQPESSYRSPQRWAVADPTATSRLLRRMVSHHADFLEPAARRRRGLPGALPG